MLIAASTGHGHLRTVEELAQWFRVAASARLGSTVLTALLRPEDGRPANERLTGLLGRIGLRRRLCAAGRDLPPDATDELVAANMQPVVEAAAKAGLAVGLYSIPDVSGLPMSPNAAARLVAGSSGEQIVAIKVTEASYEASTLRFLQDPRLARLKIVQGWDPHLARALRDGPQHDPNGRQRCGVTSGPMSLAIWQYQHILAAAERGDWDEVAAAQAAVTALFQAMQDDPAKFADLQRAKFIMGLGQPLTGIVTHKQFERVLFALATLSRPADQSRLARSLDLMGDGPFHHGLSEFFEERDRGQETGDKQETGNRKQEAGDSGQKSGIEAPPSLFAGFPMPAEKPRAMAVTGAGDATTTLADLRDLVRRFVDERDWRQFHSPKNLSMSLAIEAAELMEHFQWIDMAESRRAGDDLEKLAAIREEIADVLCYALALANELNIDLSQAVREKLVKNAAKYPADECRGRYDRPSKILESAMNLSRRELLESLGIAAAGAITAGYTATAKGYAANETIRVGCIGTGGRCRTLMKPLATIPGVQIVAVCDVWDYHLDEGRKLAQPAPLPRRIIGHCSIGRISMSS